MSERILLNELRSLSSEKWVHIELRNENIYEWDVALVVLNPSSMYDGGYFKARMTFPKNYPYAPPAFRFLLPIYHPNIHTDGRVCISILHPPGDDEMSGELAAERWSPAQRVESVLISILSLLDDAEISSPANVDAAVMLRNDPTAYRAKVNLNVEASRATAPAGFKFSAPEPTPHEVEKEDLDFWADSDVDSDPFGGSDSDGDLDMDALSGSDVDDDEDEDEDDDGRA
ncbi:ubiquitin-conjugating enzyme E2 R [Penicillium angulare]|uniref:ubiquitin-conjugating enzyme E2 R n=1 Tax=Penicillium angulare TaxID=116970 RepID=UPI002541B016|nr:ubiquitin-conjugating enzyme E2 R [Penicillium angulare]KAJ5280385.1 ubiquitin-conjugating enzyme E2 R [Penicillium angulare]